MAEVNAADTWIYATLAADSTLLTTLGGTAVNKLFADQVRETATDPYVLFGLLSGVDYRIVGPSRVWTNMLWVIRGVMEADGFHGDLQTIADRIDAVLHAGSGSNGDGTVYACVRESPFRMVENRDGRAPLRHLGGIYRILAR